MNRQFIRAFCERQTDAPGQEGDPVHFVASTANMARDGLVIEVAGWELENYRKCPTVLWAHDYLGKNLPIGRAEVRVEGDQLVADILFDQADEFARQIEHKYRTGFLHAVSVGWNTLEVAPGKGGTAPHITRAELLDISAVPIPGDPDALVEREFRALQALMEDQGNSGEGHWEALAAGMVAVFTPGPDDTDEAREKQYRALLPGYRRLGKTPPEFRAKADLEPLSALEVRGLFLEGEADSIALPESRAGAVLSKRNQDDLRQAVTLIQSVLERAKKEEDTPETDEERGLDETNLHLFTFVNQLENLK